MTLILPTTPGAIEFNSRLITSRSENSPAFGTSDQRFARMGSRYAFDVRLEPMSNEDAMDWVDLETEDETCVWPVPLIDFNPGPEGAPKIDGAGQTGSTVNLKGLTPYLIVRKGQWLSVVTSGRRYLYRARSEVVADASGDVAVPLCTLLRVPHADDDVVEIEEPKIEGFVTLPEDAWRIQGEDRSIWLSFTIKERA